MWKRYRATCCGRGKDGTQNCVWSGIDQAARLPPASGSVWWLTPTSCAARKWRWSLDEEAPGEERSDGNGVNLTLSNDVKDTGSECACGMTMNNVDTTLSWATECAVMCSREKVCCGTFQEVNSVYKTDFKIQGFSHAAKELEGDSRTRLIETVVHQVEQKRINCWSAEQSSVYSLQGRIKTDDSYSGKRGMFRAMWDLSQSARSLLPEALDRRGRLLNLWHMLGSHKIFR